MEQYQIRLIEESRELERRYQKLRRWLLHRADELISLPGAVTNQDFNEFCLMFRQLRVMAEYRHILYTRLDAMHLDPCSSAPDELTYSDTDTIEN